MAHVAPSKSVVAATRDRLGPAIVRHKIAVVVAFAFIVGLVIALRAHRTVLYDDAAITMRYAYRIAHGAGWTYNNGDHTNGASAPLYTLLLAIASFVGANLETAAKAIGCLCFAASVGLVAFIGARLAGVFAGALGALFLIASLDYQINALSGMESVFAAVLGLAVIACLLEDRETWAGVFLGLALFNKLDAGLLALAVAAVVLVIMRKPPWRIAAISASIVAPWLLFSWAYFGSPLPYSMTQKLSTVGNPASSFDHAWILDALRADGSLPVALFAVAALLAMPALARTNRWHAVALGVCVAWPFAHAVTYSFLDLGDPYPWYKTVLFPPMAIAGACALGLAARAVTSSSRPVVLAVVAAAVIVGVGLQNEKFGPLRTVTRTVVHGHQLDDYEALEATRRDAGVYLDRVARPDDVIQTCFGWIAYGAVENPIQETCPLNTRDPVAAPRWTVDVKFPGLGEVVVPSGATIRKEFVSTVGAGGRTIVEVFGPTSRSPG